MENHLFLSYNTFDGIKTSIFFCWDQQKCETDKQSIKSLKIQKWGKNFDSDLAQFLELRLC